MELTHKPKIFLGLKPSYFPEGRDESDEKSEHGLHSEDKSAEGPSKPPLKQEKNKKRGRAGDSQNNFSDQVRPKIAKKDSAELSRKRQKLINTEEEPLHTNEDEQNDPTDESESEPQDSYEDLKKDEGVSQHLPPVGFQWSTKHAPEEAFRMILLRCLRLC